MTLFSRWLPAITQTPILRKAALTTAGLAVAGGAIAGPLTATVAHAEPAKPAAPAAASQSSAKELGVRYEAQSTYYYCGPASTRIALSAQGKNLTQDDVAKKLGTTENGTDSAEDTTRVLNKETGSDTYKTTAIPGKSASSSDLDQLKTNVKNSVDNNRAVVANIAGTATDIDGVSHSYAGGHYVSLVGYRDNGEAVKISDPANPNQSSYWVDSADMANWIATRGYSH